jgi:hypothetical protein
MHPPVLPAYNRIAYLLSFDCRRLTCLLSALYPILHIHVSVILRLSILLSARMPDFALRSLESMLWTVHEQVCVISCTSHCQKSYDRGDWCSCLDCSAVLVSFRPRYPNPSDLAHIAVGIAIIAEEAKSISTYVPCNGSRSHVGAYRQPLQHHNPDYPASSYYS